MTRLLLTVTVVLALTGAATGSAKAGPIEDGQAALERGDYASALSLWLPLAERGDVKAQMLLGSWYEHGRIVAGRVVGQNRDEGLRWYRRAAEQGNIDAEFELGFMYLAPGGLASDASEGDLWLHRAADQGHPIARAMVSSIVRPDELALKRREYGETLPIFRQAADKGDPKAEFDLGTAYLLGHGVARDYAQAAIWLRKAADAGEPDAQLSMGELYFVGWGVTKDPGVAIGWYRRAADRGVAEAQQRLGALYQLGQGVPQDFVAAGRWFREAANQGVPGAQGQVGYMYASGVGAFADPVQAYKWFRLEASNRESAAYQRQGALQQLKETSDKMTPSEIEEAATLVGLWSPHVVLGKSDVDRDTEDYDEVLRAFPTDADAYFHRGLTRVQDRDFARAVSDFDVAVSLKPTSFGARINDCWTRAIVGAALPKAIEVCDRAIELGPKDASGPTARALVEFKRGEFAQAVSDANTALTMDPKAADAMYLRGLAEERLGSRSTGAIDVATAAVLDPGVAKQVSGWNVVP